MLRIESNKNSQQSTIRKLTQFHVQQIGLLKVFHHLGGNNLF